MTKLNPFKALMLTHQADETTHASVQEFAPEDLPEGEVLVSVEYSSLNYKDGLAITGKGKVVRQYPMIPGIDLAGTVLESSASDYQPGDKVIATGWGLGERYWGGFSQVASLKSSWLVPLASGINTKSAMTIGTAGFTAMLSVMALEESAITPDDQAPVLVTGASGGVGSMAIALLASLGYTVHALSGRPENVDYLKSLGASDVINRGEMNLDSRPLEAQKWAGVIDTVGSKVLARAIAETRYGGVVTACGLAGGSELQTTVMPFILRGIKLVGIDSVLCPFARRQQTWNRLAKQLPTKVLNCMEQTITLSDLPQFAEAITRGQVRGRIVVDLQAS